jgi:mono/diheme cytochrome c family protein
MVYAAAALPAFAQGQAETETGWSTYFAHCAGCHDSERQVSAPRVPQMRLMGEPRIRHALTVEGGAMMPYANIVPRDEMEALIGYLSPNADPSEDCGIPGSGLVILSPQCPDGTPLTLQKAK